MSEKSMIDGIGGAFLFSNNAKKLVQWYCDCFGLAVTGTDEECNSIYKTFEYRDSENPEIKKTIVWAILPTDQDIAGKPRTGQINYTVKNMEEMLAHLAAKNIAVDDMKNYDYGKFAWIKDPEGNQIELWEPA